MLHSRWGATQHCAFLADIGQVIVAGHIVPLAVLMGNGHHTILPSRKEIVRLALPPILIDQIIGISPLEVFLNSAVIEANPGIVVTQAIDELLLCG